VPSVAGAGAPTPVARPPTAGDTNSPDRSRHRHPMASTTGLGLRLPFLRPALPRRAALPRLQHLLPSGRLRRSLPMLRRARRPQRTHLRQEASASQRRRLAVSPTARRGFQLSAMTRRPIPKSRVSEMTSSVRRERVLLEVLLEAARAVVAAQLWIDGPVVTFVRNTPEVCLVKRRSKMTPTWLGRPCQDGRGSVSRGTPKTVADPQFLRVLEGPQAVVGRLVSHPHFVALGE
jgi:hypothetical protein